MNLEHEENNQYYSYLNELRESGITNMFGASPYLQEEFGLEKQEAAKLLTYWMENFDKLQTL